MVTPYNFKAFNFRSFCLRNGTWEDSGKCCLKIFDVYPDYVWDCSIIEATDPDIQYCKTKACTSAGVPETFIAVCNMSTGEWDFISGEGEPRPCDGCRSNLPRSVHHGRVRCRRVREWAAYECWLECDFGYVANGSNVLTYMCAEGRRGGEFFASCERADVAMVIGGEGLLLPTNKVY